MATQSNFETIQFNQLGDEFLFTTKLNPESAVIKHNFETGEILKSFAVGNAKGGKDIFSIVKELLQGASYDEYEQRFSVSACYSTNYAKIYAVILTFEYLSEEDGTGHYSMEQGEPSLRLIGFDPKTGGRKIYPRIELGQLGFQKTSLPTRAIPAPSGNQFTVANGSSVYVVDSKTAEILIVEEFEASVAKIGYSPDGRHLAVGTESELRILDSTTGEVVFETDAPYPLFGFSRDAERLVWASARKQSDVQVIDTRSFKPVFMRSKTIDDRSSVCLSDDGKKVFIGLKDSRIECWELAKLSRSVR